MCKTKLKSIFALVVPLAMAAISVAPAAQAQDQVALLDVLSVSAPSQAAQYQGDARYQEGLALQAAGNEWSAFKAFHEAAVAGNAQAQRRLGEIYDGKTAVVERDYAKSIRWYQLARLGGEQIALPIRHSLGATGFIR